MSYIPLTIHVPILLNITNITSLLIQHGDNLNPFTN